jgi:hypothetical protein
MQLNPRETLLQFGHVLQQELFPALAESVGELTSQLQLLAAVAALAPLGRMLSACRAATGRPAKDRAALATAFMAKAVLNLPTTRDLIGRLRVDEALRTFCGWPSVRALPHESKFSRAFGEFAATQLPQKLHEAVIAATQGERLIGHIARDSTAIPARGALPGRGDSPKARRPPVAQTAQRRSQGPSRAQESRGARHANRAATQSETGPYVGRPAQPLRRRRQEKQPGK